MEIAPGKAAIPVTILCGFLGAGKTTLLNRILNGSHGLRVAVLVNDFGAINIDTELIVGVEENAISLANGCVCCQLRDDLIGTVRAVIARPQAPQYILLEASGVADPSGIAATFMLPIFSDKVRLDSVIAVVDAEQAFAYPGYPDIQELKLRQINFADLVVLNKVDLVSEDERETVRDWLESQFNHTRIVEARQCNVSLEILLGVGRFDARQLDDERSIGDENEEHSHHDHEQHDHGDTFVTWSYESDRPMSLAALREMAEKLAGTIYRCKGVVFAAEAPERRAILQVVGRRADVALEDEWGERIPRTRIVAIGAVDGVDEQALTDQFDACIVQSPNIEPDLDFGGYP